MKQIIIAASVLAFTILLISAIVSGSWILAGVLALLPIVMMALSGQAFLLLLPATTLHSGLYIPGIPGNFQMFHALAAVYVLLAIANFAFTKGHARSRRTIDIHLALFMIGWIILLMFVRGTGLRILGSTEIGGGDYFQAIVAMLFFILTLESTVNSQKVRVAGLLMGGLSILPMLANALYEFSGGAIRQQLLFFRFGVSLGQVAEALENGRGFRLAFLSPGVALLWIGVFGLRPKSSWLFSRYFWWPLAGVIALLSGYRSVVISTFAFFGIYLFIRSRSRAWYTFCVLLIGSIALVLASAYAKELPFPVQRVIGNLPWIDVEWEAEAEGLSTMIWRRSVWELASMDIERYWLLGRGITFNPSTIPLVEGYRNDPIVAYITGAFHQASLELLILYGAPALIGCALLFITFLWRKFRLLANSKWHDPAMKDWALCILLYIAIRAALSFAGGISAELLTVLPVWMALYNIISNTDRMEGRARAEAAARPEGETQKAGKDLSIPGISQ